MILELPEVRAWSIGDLEKLDTGDFHLELDEGQLLVMPAARYPWNSRITVRLLAYFEARGRLYLLEPGVLLPSGARTPDLGVFNNQPEEAPYHRADEFAIVIEVASAATSSIDYNTKPAKYAEGGIPEYWIVDRHPDDDRDALVHIHRLVRGAGATYRLERTVQLSKLEQE
jgi:Uma2 family endonuclease